MPRFELDESIHYAFIVNFQGKSYKFICHLLSIGTGREDYDLIIKRPKWRESLLGRVCGKRVLRIGENYSIKNRNGGSIQYEVICVNTELEIKD